MKISFEEFLDEISRTTDENPPEGSHFDIDFFKTNKSQNKSIAIASENPQATSTDCIDMEQKDGVYQATPKPLTNSYNTPTSCFNTIFPISQSFFKKDKFEELLNNISSSISIELEQKIFEILSLTGSCLERLFMAITQEKLCAKVNFNRYSITYDGKNYFSWNISFEYGDEIISFYAHFRGLNLVNAVDSLYFYLQEHEYKNSFASDDKKNYWQFESTPLIQKDLPNALNTLIKCLKYKCISKSIFSCNKIEYAQVFTRTLPTGEDRDIIFTLWKSKDGTLQWFAKEKPIGNKELPSLEAQSPSLSSMINLAGEEIKGSKVKPKALLIFILSGEPFISQGDEIWLFGPAKSFKSWLARCFAHSLSYGGDFLLYRASKGLSVLYIDAELKPYKFNEFCRMELAGFGFSDDIKLDSLLAKTPTNQTGRIDVLDESWQEKFEKTFPDYDIIILDCYYKLTKNQVKSTEFLNWLAYWKNKGKTFIIVDHTNSEGELQGSIDKLRSADLCIKLTGTKDGKLELSFPEARYLSSENSKSLILKKVFEGDQKFYFELDEQIQVESVPDDFKRKALCVVLKKKYKLHIEKDITKLLNYGKSTISKWIMDFSEDELATIEKHIYEEYQKCSLDELKAEANLLKK